MEQLYNHYLIEKELAQRLFNSDRSQRSAMYKSMYDELFQLVPDHPRLKRRSSIEQSEKANQNKLGMLKNQLGPDRTIVEFGAGDCQFCVSIASKFHKVIAVDISDQREPGTGKPINFELMLYDGNDLPIPSESVDVVFSDQLIEHLHPEDIASHFSTVLRILRPGGIYVLCTPHGMSGPHDISKYFSDVPEGFHLKEWTYVELFQTVKAFGFSSATGYRRFRGYNGKLPLTCIRMLEGLAERLPTRARRLVSLRLFPVLFATFTK
ncbi:MAG: class I SAM-dependent methyltransferase [Pseudomonadales bacterium]